MELNGLTNGAPNALGRQVASLIVAVEELKTEQDMLRAELDALKRGGWTVNIGPFQQKIDANGKLKGSTNAGGVSDSTATAQVSQHPLSTSKPDGSHQYSGYKDGSFFIDGHTSPEVASKIGLSNR